MQLKEKEPVIYLIGGKSRSGKDTIAQLMKQELEAKGLSCLVIQFAYYMKNYAQIILNWDGSEKTKPREFLQQLGTSIIRQKIDPDFLIKRMMDDLKIYSYFFDVIIISDARYKKEFDVIKEHFKAFTIQVARPNFDNGLTEEQKNHITEIDLDDYENPDFFIKNDQGIEELKEKIMDIIRRML